jgi:hypothetical protein
MLRYLPGTRPISRRYIWSQNGVARYDSLQVAWLSSHSTEGDSADVGVHYGSIAFYGSDVRPKLSCGPRIRIRVKCSRKISASIQRLKCAYSQFKSGEATLFSRGGNSQSSLARSAVEFSDARVRRNSSASRHSRFLFVGVQLARASLYES